MQRASGPVRGTSRTARRAAPRTWTRRGTRRTRPCRRARRGRRSPRPRDTTPAPARARDDRGCRTRRRRSRGRARPASWLLPDRMAQSARQRAERLPARPAGRVRVAADAADLVAADAQRLAGAVMTAGACGGIAARLAAVLVLGGGPTQPGGCGLRRPSPATPSDVWQLAQRSAVWHVWQAPGSARASSAWRDTKPARWTLGVIGSAKFAVAGRTATVLPWQSAQNFALWHDSHRSPDDAARVPCSRSQSPSCARWVCGQRARVFEIAVAGVARARVARGVVIVAAEARRHRRAHVLVALGDADVAAHAVAARLASRASRDRTRGAIAASASSPSAPEPA